MAQSVKDHDFLQKVGERLKQLRVDANMMQKDVAAMLQIAPSTMTRYETGQIQPDLKSLCWYAETFEVSVDWILGRVDEKQPQAEPIMASAIQAPANQEHTMNPQGISLADIEGMIRRVLKEQAGAHKKTTAKPVPPVQSEKSGILPVPQETPPTMPKPAMPENSYMPPAQDAIDMLYKQPKPKSKKDKSRDGKKKKKK